MSDLAHRVLWTFIESFTGFLVAEPVIELFGGTFDVPFWQVAAGSAVASAIVPVKEYARKRLARSEADVEV